MQSVGCRTCRWEFKLKPKWIQNGLLRLLFQPQRHVRHPTDCISYFKCHVAVVFIVLKQLNTATTRHADLKLPKTRLNVSRAGLTTPRTDQMLRSDAITALHLRGISGL